LHVNQDGRPRSAWQLLSQPEINLDRLVTLWPDLIDIKGSIRERIEIEASYDVYLDRQRRDQSKLRRDEAVLIPEDFDVSNLSGLSAELKQKLLTRRPASLAEAERIDGMTPAALALILVHLRKQGKASHAA
jgi:tRNA uridine 5-carboxymethylaminomethyl modification enzyme